MIGLVFAHVSAMSRIIAEISVEHLRELQRFAEAGRVGASLIHDISSPLTAAILHLEQNNPDRLSSIRHARRSIRVLERYIEAARRQLSSENEPAIFNMGHEINQIKCVLEPLARRRQVTLRFATPTDKFELFGDAIKFQRIIINLVTNALDAYTNFSAPQKCVTVSVKTCQEQLTILVCDRGKGIPAADLPRLFEPFYTTKQPGTTSGLGIGLSTVRQYVEEDFRGHITVLSNKASGTVFTVKLPAQSRDRQPKNAKKNQI